MNPQMAKLLVAVVLDILDFTIGRVPGFELVWDIIMTAAAVAMFGWAGLFALWEVGDPTGQIDGFAPTMTLIALTQLKKKSGDAHDVDKGTIN